MFLAKHAFCAVVAASAVVLTAVVASVVYPLFRPEGDPFWLRVELVPESSSYSSGENVPMKLTLFNPGTRPVNLVFGGCQYVWYVYDLDGTLVRGEIEVTCSLVGTGISLDPGETHEFSLSWDQRDNEGNQVPRGGYFVTAFVLSTPMYTAVTVFSAGL